jgi:hypothetical protein
METLMPKGLLSSTVSLGAVASAALAVTANHAKGHLRLLVDKHDSAILRRVELVVLVHVLFGSFYGLICSA